MPSITIWNRIEPRCRALDVQPGLDARVHDPLWLLGRQWQIGEFEGCDAGSPVLASMDASFASIDRFVVGNASAQTYDGVQPIEALIEREPVRPATASADLFQAVEGGLYFLRLLTAAKLPSSIANSYVAQYPLVVSSGDSTVLASVVAGRVIDGIKLHADLTADGNNLPPQPAIPTANSAAVLQVTRSWLAWYESLFTEPATPDGGWSTDRMEYQFKMASAGEAGSYIAQEYDGGSVEWYTFDRSTVKLVGGSAQTSPVKQTQIPTPVTFAGMPARRYWEFEDGGTNIAVISAAAEDIGRLLLREFALIFGNDWFQFPLVAPVGCEYLITSLSVADTFGIVTAIPHYTAFDGVGGKWRLFDVSPDPLAPPALTNTTPPHPLLITPGAVATMDSAAIEDVLLLRDELANAAWGIERTVVAASGQLLDRTLEWRTNAPPVPPPNAGPTLNYRLGSTVPDYWVPFLPASVNANGRLQLRRGKLPMPTSEPLGRLLANKNMTIFLEEVPREGVHLQRRYRLSRGTDGSTWLWVGRLCSTGSGEGRSGLCFDYVE